MPPETMIRDLEPQSLSSPIGLEVSPGDPHRRGSDGNFRTALDNRWVLTETLMSILC